jgi:hypothetical protein
LGRSKLKPATLLTFYTSGTPSVSGHSWDVELTLMKIRKILIPVLDLFLPVLTQHKVMNFHSFSRSFLSNSSKSHSVSYASQILFKELFIINLPSSHHVNIVHLLKEMYKSVPIYAMLLYMHGVCFFKRPRKMRYRRINCIHFPESYFCKDRTNALYADVVGLRLQLIDWLH